MDYFNNTWTLTEVLFSSLLGARPDCVRVDVVTRGAAAAGKGAVRAHAARSGAPVAAGAARDKGAGLRPLPPLGAAHPPFSTTTTVWGRG